jgi:hypothetical protein
MPLPLDPESGKPMSGNLMADGRAGTLNSQIRDASQTHLALLKFFDKADMARLIDFESRLFTAQTRDKVGGPVDSDGAVGGPEELARSEAGQLGSIGRAVWSEFAVWEKPPPHPLPRRSSAPSAPRWRAARSCSARKPS